MKELTLLAPAKINLYLEIASIRHDGYHNIESVMQTVDLFDTLTFKTCEGEDKTVLECDDERIPTGESNLICRAAKLFFEHTEIGSQNLKITLEKRIPMAAGLAGGSSDAATTLIGLNKLYGADLSVDELCMLGARIGADVPFCVRQGISVIRGIGDVFSPCAPMPDCFIVVACGGEGVSTPWAYRRVDELCDYSTRGANVDEFAKTLESGNIADIASKMSNIFELAVLPERPVAQNIRDTMTKCGALRAMMSGSGPSVFGVFKDVEKANFAVDTLEKQGIAAHLTKPFYPAT